MLNQGSLNGFADRPPHPGAPLPHPDGSVPLTVRSGSPVDERGGPVSFEVVNAYTLLVGDADGRPLVSVHTTADDAWRALDREVRVRCGMRERPRRRMDADAAARLANAWRSGDPECRYWNVTVHSLPIPVPVIARTPALAR